MTHLIYMWRTFEEFCRNDPHKAFLMGVKCAAVLCTEHSEPAAAAALRAELETSEIAQKVIAEERGGM